MISRSGIRSWNEGGRLGGRDYLDWELGSGLYRVKKAVDEFAGAHGYEAVPAHEKDWPSWFVRIV